jgi:hypothetical protein
MKASLKFVKGILFSTKILYNKQLAIIFAFTFCKHKEQRKNKIILTIELNSTKHA